MEEEIEISSSIISKLQHLNCQLYLYNVIKKKENNNNNNKNVEKDDVNKKKNWKKEVLENLKKCSLLLKFKKNQEFDEIIKSNIRTF